MPADRVNRVRLLPGSFNVRDLGGLPTGDGWVTRPGRIYRGDYPGFADVDDGAALRELGLHTVVDLRRRNEADLECVTWDDHGVHYERCPLSAGAESSWHTRYQGYLTHRPETVVAAVRRVIDPASHPVLFHCAAGKDRTGTIAALVLSLLGVPAEEIVADYVLTEQALADILARLATVDLYAEMLADSGFEGQRPRAEHMFEFLAWLDRHGGAATWLVAHGLAAAEIDTFEEAMLER